MAATSQPLATQIALDVMKKGGSAVDAAIAANAALGLMEPTGNGIGGDLFAIVWCQADRYAEIETRLKAMTANGGKLSRRLSPPLPAVPATRGGGVAGRRRPRETGCGAAIVGRDEHQR
ncbi:hypothetical protein G6F59_017049 [Rhizopus arrhizus]|nr:hypothetical protein G6F59_017049 [Rhizopus arrhizus]